MKTRMIRMFLALGMVSAFGTALHAQTYDLAANVPFKFQAGDRVQEPGKYLVRQDGSGVTTIRNMVSGHPTLLPGVYARLGHTYSGKLVFHCYNGNGCFLAEIWPAGGNGSPVPMSKTEKNLVKAGESEVATIAIDLRRAD